jgi:hypothetical protein
MDILGRHPTGAQLRILAPARLRRLGIGRTLLADLASHRRHLLALLAEHYSINNLSTDIASKGLTIDYNLFYNSGQDPHLCQWLNRSTFPFTWSQWIAAGLDAHSVVADPMFTNATGGDYSVKTGSPALALGFKNFPMTGFGVTSGSQQPVGPMPESPKN